MKRPRPTSPRERLQTQAVVIACLAAIAIASPAHAGLGDLVKKAKDKAAKAVAPKAEQQVVDEEPGELVFDDVVLELNDERIESILATYDAVGAVSAGRPAIVDKLNKAMEARSAHSDKHEEAIEARRMKRSEVELCYADGYQEATDRAAEEYRNKALTDPAILEKFTKAAAENNEAAARGDSAAMKRITDVLRAAMQPTREDSVQVRQSCGPLPPRLPAEDQLDALESEVARLESELRAIDEKVAAAQSKQGGLDRQQWAMAIERIQMYIAWKRSQPSASRSGSSSGSSGSKGSSGSSSAASQTKPLFSDTEIAALEKYLERIRATFG